MIDRNDGKEWSQLDVANLEDALERGESIDEAAAFLGRSGTVGDVARKAKAIDLGLISRDDANESAPASRKAVRGLYRAASAARRSRL